MRCRTLLVAITAFAIAGLTLTTLAADPVDTKKLFLDPIDVVPKPLASDPRSRRTEEPASA